MKTVIREITPEIAQEMLKRNINNRKLSTSHVDFLSKQMESGHWIFDGQPLRFTENGGLLDGQHRLSAIIKSGCTFEFLVITGVKSDAFKVMDTGRSRDASDVLSIHGVTQSKVTSTIIRTILSLNAKNPGRYGGRYKFTNTDILNFYNKNKRISDSVLMGSWSYRESGRMISASDAGSFHFLFSAKNFIKGEEFIRKLSTGLDLDSKHPIYLLRKALLRDKISVKKLPKRNIHALIIKAWNLSLSGKDIKILRWDPNIEKFPKII